MRYGGSDVSVRLFFIVDIDSVAQSTGVVLVHRNLCDILLRALPDNQVPIMLKVGLSLLLNLFDSFCCEPLHVCRFEL